MRMVAQRVSLSIALMDKLVIQIPELVKVDAKKGKLVVVQVKHLGAVMKQISVEQRKVNVVQMKYVAQVHYIVGHIIIEVLQNPENVMGMLVLLKRVHHFAYTLQMMDLKNATHTGHVVLEQ